MNHGLYGARRQCEVFGALLQRELEWRFARRSLGMFEEVSSIIVHVATFSFLRIISGSEIHDSMPVLPFITSGVFIYWLLRTGVNNVSSAVFLVNRYAPFASVTPLDVALARGAVNLILYAFLGMASFYVLQLLGYSGPIRDPFRVFGMLLYAGVFGIGCGLFFGGVFYYAPIMRTVVLTGCMRILALISGTYFVIPDIPARLRPYAVYNPLLNMSDMMREAYFATYNADQADPAYVFYWVVGAVAVGLIVERALRPVSSTRLS
jgi:capsular polysaccharide transport system permease protein